MKETKKERFIQAWKTVFDLDEVKDDDNFFEVGGDSMKGVQLISILAGYGLKLDMLKLYTQPTVEELVEAAEEMEPVEIPADVINGSMSGEEIEKYLADPTVRKAMAEFGIRPEDVMEKMRTNTKASGAEEPKATAGAGGIPPFTGAEPGAVPPFVGGQPGAVPPFVALQPGAIPVQGGYLIPVPVMYYFVPFTGPDGKPVQQPTANSFPGDAAISGSAPIPVMAYPVFPQWSYGVDNTPENMDSNNKE
ncbi:MAG: acyl carrier protein [Parasporobacterium sp.]|nr:acyl carrier protein [Parasporobacterium sp.]